MALRNLATRMRNPAAAALRVLPPAPRVSPPAATRPRFYTSQVSSSPEDKARKLLKDNLDLLEEVKQHHKYMRSRIWWFVKGGKCLSRFFMLLSPVPLVVAVVKATPSKMDDHSRVV